MRTTQVIVFLASADSCCALIVGRNAPRAVHFEAVRVDDDSIDACVVMHSIVPVIHDAEYAAAATFVRAPRRRSSAQRPVVDARIGITVVW